MKNTSEIDKVISKEYDRVKVDEPQKLLQTDMKLAQSSLRQDLLSKAKDP